MPDKMSAMDLTGDSEELSTAEILSQEVDPKILAKRVAKRIEMAQADGDCKGIDFKQKTAEALMHPDVMWLVNQRARIHDDTLIEKMCVVNPSLKASKHKNELKVVAFMARHERKNILFANPVGYVHAPPENESRGRGRSRSVSRRRRNESPSFNPTPSPNGRRTLAKTRSPSRTADDMNYMPQRSSDRDARTVSFASAARRSGPRTIPKKSSSRRESKVNIRPPSKKQVPSIRKMPDDFFATLGDMDMSFEKPYDASRTASPNKRRKGDDSVQLGNRTSAQMLLGDQITALEFQAAELRGQNTSLKTENADLKTENAGLKTENTTLKIEKRAQGDINEHNQGVITAHEKNAIQAKQKVKEIHDNCRKQIKQLKTAQGGGTTKEEQLGQFKHYQEKIVQLQHDLSEVRKQEVPDEAEYFMYAEAAYGRFITQVGNANLQLGPEVEEDVQPLEDGGYRCVLNVSLSDIATIKKCAMGKEKATEMTPDQNFTFEGAGHTDDASRAVAATNAFMFLQQTDYSSLFDKHLDEVQYEFEPTCL